MLAHSLVSIIVLQFFSKTADEDSAISHSPRWIECEKYIKSLAPLSKRMWMDALLVERLQRKKEDIDALLQQNNNDWSETFYWLLARSFGFGKNSSCLTPLSSLRRRKTAKI